MADLRIDLAAEFRGKKAFTTASKSVVDLEKSVKKLGRTLGVTLSAAAVIAYGKASVKAFKEDQQAAAALANTLKNLGIEFAIAANEKFIASLEAATNVADDLLRPALQKLLTTTGSLLYSQDLLAKAIEISRGSGVDLLTVANDLSMAWVGNTKGLKKYALGLTNAQLAGMTFEQIMAALNAQFAGSNAAYLETYAGKIDALTLAANNAKETIGKGLVDAFTILLGGADQSITTVTEKINDLATGIANFIRGTAYYVNKLVNNKAVQYAIKAAAWLAKFVGLDLITDAITAVGKKGASLAKPETEKPITAAQKAFLEAQRQQAIRQAQILKAQKAATAEQKKQTALKKAGTVFDLEQIQLVAALKGKLSAEERLRVEAQLALLNGNVEVAKKLTDQILAAQDSSGNLAKFLAALPNARNPFEYLDAYLTYLANKAAAITTNSTFTQNPPSGGGTSTQPSIPSTNVPKMPSDGTISYNVLTGLSYNPNAAQPVINVTVQGNVIREEELINKVLAGAQLSSLSGSPSQIGRISGMFG